MPVTLSRVCSSLLGAGLAAVLLIACGGGDAANGSNGDASANTTAIVLANQLPALPAGVSDVSREGSVAQQIVVKGKDTYGRSTGAVDNGDSLELAAGTGALEYAIYQFPAGSTPQTITANVTIGTAGMEFWLALANYAASKWEFAGPFTANQVIDVTALDGSYISGNGNVYGAVLVYDGNSATIGNTMLDYDDGQSGSADYLTDIEPLFADNCMTCHNSGSFTGVELHAFWAVRHNQSLLVAQVVDGSHGSLDQTGKDAVQSFVDAGGPYGQTITYTDNIWPLAQASCGSCHTTNSAGGVNFNTYAKAAAAAQSSLTAILAETMPTSSPLSDDDKDLWQAWVDQDKPE